MIKAAAYKMLHSQAYLHFVFINLERNRPWMLGTIYKVEQLL